MSIHTDPDSGPVRMTEHTIEHFSDASRPEQIKVLKEWCMANYTRGADTMIECWDDGDYERLFVVEDLHFGPDYNYERTGQQHTFAEAFETLFSVASVYWDRICDAKNSAF